ncbi:MAG: THUMP domain-containing protein [Thermoplasmatota archaeon]
MALLLVRYGELALKSPPVRLRFERALVRNIEEMFLSEGLECLTSREWGRIFLHVEDAERAARPLRRVFGVTSFSPALECSSALEDVVRLGTELAAGSIREGMSFAVRARRSGSHPYTSQELAASVGRAVLEACADRRPRVDLEAPDIELYVEVRGRRAFLFFDRVQGPGGLPLGTQGRVMALLNGERSAAAAWLMMKRGCRVLPVAHASCAPAPGGAGAGAPPSVRSGPAAETGGEPSPSGPAREAFELLRPWAPGIRLHPLEDASLEALVALAGRRRAEAVVLGSTWDELRCGIPVACVPILFPLCGLSGDEIGALVERIRSAQP